MSTIPSLFAQSVERYGANTALIEPIENEQVASLTYLEVQARVHRFAGYLQQQQLPKGGRIMIWAASRSDWLIAYFAALLVGLVVVPIDVNSKEDFIQRLVDTTETSFLVTTQKQYATLKNPPVPMIDLDHLPEGPFDSTLLPPINENDLAELVFTSGTTGQPKGVMLSHRNITSNAHAALQVVKISTMDRALSILPLSHMFEMTIDIALIQGGASIVYARSLSPDTLFRLLATQNITLMVLVPQALQLFMNGIEREIRKQHKEKAWKILHRIAACLPFSLRRYVFKMIHTRFGGKFRLFVSGGAPLPPQLGHTWENMGFRVLHGYGATECSPVVSVNPLHDHTIESAGQALPGVDIRISHDEEVQVHGANVALGYWKNPEATAAAFQNGWYNTGDLGYLDKKGNLYLKGRKKNLIVLANGMNVYPEDIENLLQTQGLVKDAVVIGLEERGNGPTVHAILLMEDPNQAKAAIQSINKQLAAHQQIRGYTIWPEKDFPRTHTLKVKRQDVLKVLPEIRAKQ